MRDDRRKALADGLIAGLIGCAALSLFFVVRNLITGDAPLRTASTLGGVLFYGMTREEAAAVVRAGPVLAYNGLHVVLFTAFGLAGAQMLLQAERRPVLFYPFATSALLAATAAFGLTTSVVGELAGVSWRSVVAADLTAFGLMATYLWLRHPRLVAALRAYDSTDATEEGLAPVARR